jgi:hypothetical protein
VREAREAFAAALSAIEALPPRLRQTRAAMETEKQVRAALDSSAPGADKN